MPKPEIHPTWYPDGRPATAKWYDHRLHPAGDSLDASSGHHPLFTGTQKILDTEGRVDRFMRKYGMGGKKKDDANS